MAVSHTQRMTNHIFQRCYVLEIHSVLCLQVLCLMYIKVVDFTNNKNNYYILTNILGLFLGLT